VTVSQKILFSFLLSALLCAGIAVFTLTGILTDYAVNIGKPAHILLLAVIFLTLFIINFFCFNLRRGSAQRTTEHTAADFTSAEAVHVEVVNAPRGSFFLFGQPFTFTTAHPELLRTTENEVVYEQDGIHYINNNVFADDEKSDELDKNFADLVESVVQNKEFELT